MSEKNAPDEAPVFIVDADDAMRESLAAMLRAAGRDVETFASAEAFLDARADVQRGCLVLDARLPGLTGIELQERLLERRCPLAILFVAGGADVATAVRAMKHGAADFLEKPVAATQLLAAIDGALAATTQPLPPALGALTRREREVLDHILAGRQTRAIAASLFISVKTVEFHRSRIHAKLKVSSMAELFRLFMRHAKPQREPD